jgi:DNA-binding NarL/FixJ family response regulator
MELLWVENHPHFVLAARRFLAGYSVKVVPSLSAARAALAKARFDVVLVDFDLDDGKGAELVRELAASTSRPMIVATSSHAVGNAALLQAGADAVCGKLQFAGIPHLLQSLTQRPSRFPPET